MAKLFFAFQLNLIDSDGPICTKYQQRTCDGEFLLMLQGYGEFSKSTEHYVLGRMEEKIRFIGSFSVWASQTCVAIVLSFKACSYRRVNLINLHSFN